MCCSRTSDFGDAIAPTVLKIDNMLERISDFLDEEIETTLSGLTALIEPILIVFLGVVVGGMVICMFLPIFKMPEIVNPKR